MSELSRKIVLAATLVLIVAMLLTPFAVAKPAELKNNDKFEYFKLVCSGAGGPNWDKNWVTPPDADVAKTRHVRDRDWITGDTVELTVGTETIDRSTTPISVDYTTTVDNQILFNNDGTPAHYCIKLTDVVTLYENDVAIGTLVLKIAAVVEFTDGAPSGYAGTVSGYGTDALVGVHVSAVDLGLVPAESGYVRVGTITGWPI